MIRSTFSGFNTALSSLQANQKRLDIVGQNLANMNTEGYTRQKLDSSSLNYVNPTSFYLNENEVNIGFGNSMDGVSQQRDQFLDVQYRTQNAKVGYNENVKASLDSLKEFMDETKIEGIATSFDNVETALHSLQDPSHVNDPVYEGEVRSRMNATTTLLNSTAQQITIAKTNEVQNITGDSTSENGYVEDINDLLKEIGQLNDDIKKNQLVGNSALELQDKRNMKIDELSKLIPIKVTIENDHDGVNNTTGASTEQIQKDADGNIVSAEGESIINAWPDDLNIDLVYSTTDANGKVTSNQTIRLVSGSHIGDTDAPTKDLAENLNYGKVELKLTGETAYDKTKALEDPSKIALAFTEAPANKPTPDAGADGKIPAKTLSSITTDVAATETDRTTLRLEGGKVQASLDMLADGVSSIYNGSTYRSYDYYMDRLDNLAQTFAMNMNNLNRQGVTGEYTQDYTVDKDANGVKTTRKPLEALRKMPDDGAATDGDGKTVTAANYLLLVNNGVSGQHGQTAEGITAANISISKNWISGTTHIGMKGDVDGQNSSTDTALNMLQSMEDPQATLSGNTYNSEMSATSTYLANDSYNNQNALKVNTTVLDSISHSKDQISGVSMDEEAANMMTYVTAYNAAAKVMTAMDNILQTLLGIAS